MRPSIAPMLGWVGLLALLAAPASGIAVGQVDTFEDETTQGWVYAAAPNLGVTTTGGPSGAGDAYLTLTTDGVSSPGGRPVVTNPSQWTGNYTAAGVTGLTMDLSNVGTESLFIRLGFEGTGGSQYVTSVAIELPAGGDWVELSFSLDASDFTQVTAGTETTFAQVLASVDRLRILSAVSPMWNGDNVAVILGVDNVLAVPEPAVWTLLALGLLALARSRRESH